MKTGQGRVWGLRDAVIVAGVVLGAVFLRPLPIDDDAHLLRPT